MTQTDRFAAQILESGARGYAALATAALMEHRPDLAGRSDAVSTWRGHIAQRMLELQTAVHVGRPRLFLERIRWSRRAYRARGVAEVELRDALTCLRSVLVDELPPTGRDDVVAMLDGAIADFDDEVEVDARQLDPEEPRGRQAMLYLLAVLEGRCREAVVELMAFQREGDLDLRECILEILVPAQREIGRLWHMGDSDIAEEHLVTATTKRAISALAHSIDVAPARDLTLMTAAVQGDSHDVGGQALTALLEADGWRGIDLGANVPSEDLVAARAAFEPDVLVVSATLSTQLTVLERSVRALRQAAGDGAKIVVAGSASATEPDLPEQWGADAVVDSIETAVAVIEGWYPRP